jgi:hypothetical protein
MSAVQRLIVKFEEDTEKLTRIAKARAKFVGKCEHDGELEKCLESENDNFAKNFNVQQYNRISVQLAILSLYNVSF